MRGGWLLKGTTGVVAVVVDAEAAKRAEGMGGRIGGGSRAD
jgi:hypothetical protein